MSACNVLVKKQSVHILMDGLSYHSDGVVVRISQKCFTMPTLHACIATIGAGGAAMIFSIKAGEVFSSFDELVDGAEDEFPSIFDRHRDLFEQCEFSDCELYVAGWSKASNQAEAYMMRIHDPKAQEFWNEATTGSEYSAEAFRLQKLDGIVTNPPPDVSELKAAGMSFNCRPEEIGEVMSPDVGLLHLMEVQRRKKTPLRPELDAHYWVGGLALLTSIDRTGITQRVLHRWTEDKVGEVVTPRPIDWKAWRASRVVAGAAIPEGLSRLQRERMEKKARKGTLRAV
ncbi:MAG: hypothetical protein Q7T45_09775 [Bradyrhizobium sp.]|uniref:hypothetical protein n=1 Tax=Bradyrhizobium sp. TaxID=376 RepID=UPI002725AAAC|nr:hypothetical protein [Bradyrhizobium sp.]MDO8398095.1 hypothetical protein [Bradyrhizobium sp.]